MTEGKASSGKRYYFASLGNSYFLRDDLNHVRLFDQAWEAREAANKAWPVRHAQVNVYEGITEGEI